MRYPSPSGPRTSTVDTLQGARQSFGGPKSGRDRSPPALRCRVGHAMLRELVYPRAITAAVASSARLSGMCRAASATSALASAVIWRG